MIYSWDEIANRIHGLSAKETSIQLLLVRHGQTDANVNRTFAGQSDAMLTKYGRRESHELIAKLPKSIDQIWCSPLRRALDTMIIATGHLPAKEVIIHDAVSLLAFQKLPLKIQQRFTSVHTAIARPGKLPQPEECVPAIHIDSRFQEISLGELEGMPIGVGGVGKNRNIDFRPPGGESYREFGRRVMSGFCHILECANRSSSEQIVLFTHAGTIRVMQTLTREHGDSKDMFISSSRNADPIRLRVSNLHLPSFW